ncbi:MAG: hypothetical protein AB7T27_09350 [Kiritimatiellia bacterium]
MHKVSMVAVSALIVLTIAAQARPPASARINIREKLGTNKAGLPTAAPVTAQPAAAAPAAAASAGTIPPAGTPPEEMPGKWFKNAEGYAEALELQKQTGADIFVFFVRPDVSNENGLCNWLETRGFQTPPVRKFLKEVIKVKATLPSNKETTAMGETFGVKKTPAVYLVHPTGKRWRCSTFTYDSKRPELPEPEVLEAQFRSQSSAAKAAEAAAAAAAAPAEDMSIIPAAQQPSMPAAETPAP